MDSDSLECIPSTCSEPVCLQWPKKSTAGKPARYTTEETAPVPTAAIPAPPAGPLPTTNQIKSILALLGVLAVLYHALRFLGWAVG